MGMTAYRRPSPPAALGASRPLPVAAAAAYYGSSGLEQVDALVLNHLAAAALEALAGVDGTGHEVELLHDPRTGEIGITPWVMGRPLTTLHHVHPTRFRSTSAGPEWADQVHAAWPSKIEAPQFMGCWHIPPISLARPAAVEIRADMLVFHPGKLVLTR